MKCLLVLPITIAVSLSPRVPMAAQEQAAQYVAPAFGYCVHVPPNWRIHNEYDDDTVAIISFGLPPMWSELEQQEIENAIAVFARKRSNVLSVQDVIDLDLKRVADILISSTEVDLEFGKAQRLITRIDGHTYMSLAAYRFENGVGYAFSFTATEGTYNRNRERFIEFLSTVEFFAPDSEAVKVYPSRFQEALLLFRAGPSSFPRAISLLESELENDPANLKAAKLLAMVYYDSDRFDEALAMFDSAIALDESLSPHTYLYKGKTLYKLGRSEEARLLLRGLWALFQGDAELSADYDEFMSLLEAEHPKEQDTGKVQAPRQ